MGRKTARCAAGASCPITDGAHGRGPGLGGPVHASEADLANTALLRVTPVRCRDGAILRLVTCTGKGQHARASRDPPMLRSSHTPRGPESRAACHISPTPRELLRLAAPVGGLLHRRSRGHRPLLRCELAVLPAAAAGSCRHAAFEGAGPAACQTRARHRADPSQHLGQGVISPRPCSAGQRLRAERASRPWSQRRRRRLAGTWGLARDLGRSQAACSSFVSATHCALYTGVCAARQAACISRPQGRPRSRCLHCTPRRRQHG